MILKFNNMKTLTKYYNISKMSLINYKNNKTFSNQPLISKKMIKWTKL
jgi:hypothetical protein